MLFVLTRRVHSSHLLKYFSCSHFWRRLPFSC